MSGRKQPISVGPADRCQCPYGGHRFRTVFATTSNDFVHAINAFDVAGPAAVSAGTIPWRKSLGRPTNFGLDGGVAMAILLSWETDRCPGRNAAHDARRRRRH